MHPRTRMMLDAALLHARAAFASSCAPKAPIACKAYDGSVWNGGTHVTVIIDRCLCLEHSTRLPFTDVEVWVYDISGDSPVYLGKDQLPSNVELLKEPGDIATPASKPPSLKS